MGCLIRNEQGARFLFKGANRRPHLILLHFEQVFVDFGFGLQPFVAEHPLRDRLFADGAVRFDEPFEIGSEQPDLVHNSRVNGRRPLIR